MNTIKLFEIQQILSVWNEKENKRYFSVQDVVEFLTDRVEVQIEKDY